MKRSIILKYSIGWLFVKLGESIIKINQNFYMAEVYTTGIGNLIYPYHAIWKTWLTPDKIPYKVLIFSKSRHGLRKKLLLFDKKYEKVTIQKLLPKFEVDEVKIKFPVYDELSAFILSFSLDYRQKNFFTIPLYVCRKRCLLKLFKKRELVYKWNNRSQKCYEILIDLPQESELLRHSREVWMWLLEKEKIPVKLIGKLPIIGNLEGILVKKNKNS